MKLLLLVLSLIIAVAAAATSVRIEPDAVVKRTVCTVCVHERRPGFGIANSPVINTGHCALKIRS